MIAAFCIISAAAVIVVLPDGARVCAGNVISDARGNDPAPQQTGKSAPPEKEEPAADTSKTLYRVTGVVLVIWTGLAIFLFRLDRKVSKLEKEITNLK
ncbi:MAG: hypothetical protein A2176_14600 [Spirochaetes bacterium RBG_13_51_14]|nr:MAG: hypothetical protein A2176_14600 [Spirochaetes bacterium RBG_13_51_14]